MDNFLQALAIIGKIDAPAAFAFVGLCAMVGIPITVMAARSFAAKATQLQLEKNRDDNETKIEIARISVSKTNGAVTVRE
jgi:hypothetical protein